MVSIIIPALNEEKYLPILLKCLNSQTFKDFEVIVSDADSTDKTVQIAKEYGAKITRGGKPAVGRNKGTSIAKGNIYIFLDSDVTFNKTFLAEVLEEFKDRNLDIATCSISKDVENRIAKAVYVIGGINDSIRQYTKFPIGTGACIIVKKEVHTALNGFNEKKELQEDWDYIKRAAQKGYKYRIIKNDFYASTRRFDNNNILKLALSAVIGAVVIGLGVKGISLVTKLYGGWGEFEKGKK